MPTLDMTMFFSQMIATECSFLVLYTILIGVTTKIRRKKDFEQALTRYVNEKRVIPSIKDKFLQHLLS